MNSIPEVLVVHCVDTEGPLDESLEATFDRLAELYGVVIQPTRANLELVQAGKHDALDAELSKAAAITFSPGNLKYNRDWPELHLMLDELFSEDFRSKFSDEEGTDWKISWFTLDHIGLDPNPRRKDLGWLHIFEEYRKRVAGFPGDEIQYHFHPSSISRNPTAPATSYLNNTSDFVEGLSRRLIDYEHFPSVFRPGFHSIRPDANLLLELWFPFDYSNQAHEGTKSQPDEQNGNFGDWSKAPLSWRGYNPSIVDYQSPGNLRRTTFRCLNVGTRLRPLEERHVRQVFDEAKRTGLAVLAFTNHDFRDIRPDIEYVYNLIRKVSKDFDGVVTRNSTAQQAAARAVGKCPHDRPQGQLTLDADRLLIKVEGEVFMPQPFLALKTKDGNYFHDNLDLGKDPKSWTYAFNTYSFELSQIEKIGVAVSGPSGGVWTKVCNLLGPG